MCACVCVSKRERERERERERKNEEQNKVHSRKINVCERETDDVRVYTSPVGTKVCVRMCVSVCMCGCVCVINIPVGLFRVEKV